MVTKNLGWIKSVKRGSTPPTNLDMLWYDTNLTGGGTKIKYYDNVLGDWILLSVMSNTPFVLMGTINSPAEFPMVSFVENGFVYVIQSNVTDNDPTRTNTGESFTAGQEIFWIDGTWEVYGSVSQSNFTESNPVDPSFIRNKPLLKRQGLSTLVTLINIPDQGTTDYDIEIRSYIVNGRESKTIPKISLQTSSSFTITTRPGYETGVLKFRIQKYD